jgi:hypothetical protein
MSEDDSSPFYWAVDTAARRRPRVNTPARRLVVLTPRRVDHMCTSGTVSKGGDSRDTGTSGTVSTNGQSELQARVARFTHVTVPLTRTTFGGRISPRDTRRRNYA